jgi:acyl-CoA dehydrogenase
VDFGLSAPEQALADRVRTFIDTELIPLEAQMAGDDGLPADVVRAAQAKVREAGLWAPDVLPEYGGLGFGEVEMLLLEMELLRALFPEYQPMWTMGIGWIKGVTMLYSGTDEQKERYLTPVVAGEQNLFYTLTEPTAGSDATDLRTTAVRKGDTYVINGVKSLASYSPDAGFAMVTAVTDQEKGARGGISVILVDTGTPGFRVSRVIDTMGPRKVAELAFEDCVVPVSNRLGDEGQGFSLGMGWINTERLYAGAYAIGRGSRILEMAMQYAEERVTFGQPLIDRQAIQWMLADSAIDLHTTKWITLQCGWKVDQGLDVRNETAIVKAYAANVIGRVADRMIQLHGGYGYTKDLPFERVYRESRTYRIEDGTDEIQKINLVRGMRKGWRP